MELFELLGKISIDGTDNVKNAIDSTVKTVKSGGNEILNVFSKIKKMSGNIFDNNKILNNIQTSNFSKGFDEFFSSDKLFNIAATFDDIQKNTVRKFADNNNTDIFYKLLGINKSFSDKLSDDKKTFWDSNYTEIINSFINTKNSEQKEENDKDTINKLFLKLSDINKKFVSKPDFDKKLIDIQIQYHNQILFHVALSFSSFCALSRCRFPFWNLTAFSISCSAFLSTFG